MHTHVSATGATERHANAPVDSEQVWRQRLELAHASPDHSHALHSLQGLQHQKVLRLLCGRQVSQGNAFQGCNERHNHHAREEEADGPAGQAGSDGGSTPWNLALQQSARAQHEAVAHTRLPAIQIRLEVEKPPAWAFGLGALCFHVPSTPRENAALKLHAPLRGCTLRVVDGLARFGAAAATTRSGRRSTRAGDAALVRSFR